MRDSSSSESAVVEIPQRELDEPRLVRLAGPTLEDRARVIASRGGKKEREVSRDVEDTRGQRQGVTSDASRPAPAVPARKHELE